MRVISGTARGIALRAPEGLGTRPTTDRVKENLFNIIQHDIRDRVVLDLFSGSGALAVEALSRGAAAAVLVEQDRASCAVIRDNLKRTRLEDRARLIQAEVMLGLEQLGREGFRADLVLLDPPYSSGWEERVLKRLLELSLLNPGAWAVVEHAADDRLPEQVGTLAAVKARRYGKTTLSLYREETR